MRTAIMALAGLLLAARAVSVSADVIHVPGDQPTIQAAINVAVDGDEVVIAPGTYNEAINFNGKAVTVRGEAGPDVTTIDATGLNTSVVRFVSSEGSDSVLNGLTITGGRAPEGGGIYAPSANPTIVSCRIVSNEAFGAWDGDPNHPGIAAGGGLYQSGSPMILQDCVFLNNSSSSQFASGGGASMASTSLVLNCSFIGNGTDACCFVGASIASGGGISTASSVVVNCTFDGNGASSISASGGGVQGGAALINCLVVNNSVFGAEVARGGGIAIGTSTIVNCTIANNAALGGSVTNPAVGGVWASGGGVNLSVVNCIVVNNDPEQVHSTGSATVRHSCIEGGFPGEGNIDADPLFIDPANGNFRLQDDSPCRDGGDNASLPPDTYDLDGDGNTSEHLSRDLDLLRRKVNGIVDMGAYEWQHACASDIAPSSPGVAGDGLVDVDDLVAVILGWGACDQCVADIDGDDQVNVDDLVLVILSWGPCS